MTYANRTKLTDSTGTVVNPATDDTVMLLRRIVKLLESQAVVDYANRQKVNVEVMPTVAVTGTFFQASQPTTITSNGGNDPRYQFMDAARLTYDNGIRSHLSFT